MLGYDPGNVSATSKTNTKTKTHTKTNAKTNTGEKISKFTFFGAAPTEYVKERYI